jgi:hypothetical protein
VFSESGDQFAAASGSWPYSSERFEIWKIIDKRPELDWSINFADHVEDCGAANLRWDGDTAVIFDWQCQSHVVALDGMPGAVVLGPDGWELIGTEWPITEAKEEPEEEFIG